MALMFQRLARNFVKNGYFPTDSETIARVLDAIEPSDEGRIRILDPCCGEGVALAECKHHLDPARTEAFGIEYDEERAWHAKQMLDHCIHGDVQDCILGRRQFGLLWLNPPYGDLVSDKARLSAQQGKGRARLEKLFYSLSVPWLAFGGVLVLIIPGYSLDEELSGWLATHFDRVQAFRAPEERFKQIVIFGVRRKVATANPAEVMATKRRLIEGREQGFPVLPAAWEQAPYTVPPTNRQQEVKFVYSRMDQRQLEEVLTQEPGLWIRFDMAFGRVGRTHRRPLRDLSEWHLALALAAGQVSGAVHSDDGRTYVIKGDTHKEKETRIEATQKSDGEISETRILTDRFVPVIRAIDMTPGSPRFGRVVVIR